MITFAPFYLLCLWQDGTAAFQQAINLEVPEITGTEY